MEVWKDIAGYEGIYQVSNEGRVKRLAGSDGYHHNVKECIRKQRMSNSGYATVNLIKNKHERRCYIHRLVAQAFVQNPDNLPQVNHKDENKLNNCADNLEWCTCLYNQMHGTKIERCTKSKSVAVCQYDLKGELIKSYSSIKEAAQQTGADMSHIVKCCKGKQKTAHNYIWRYN